MRVTVKLHAILRDYRPANFKGDVMHLDLEDGATVLHVLEHIGIPRKSLHAAFLNDAQVGVDAALNEDDFLRLFPPVVGGSSPAPESEVRIFLAGIMQGSRREKGIVAQGYRSELTQLLRRHLVGAEIIDPFVLHPKSVNYSFEEGRQTLVDLAQTAGQCDVVVAYLPEASMGTAVEIWQAYQNKRKVFIISSLAENWIVKFLSTRVFATLEDFSEFVASGEFQRAVASP